MRHLFLNYWPNEHHIYEGTNLKKTKRKECRVQFEQSIQVNFSSFYFRKSQSSSTSSARLLLIDYGLNEKLIQGICHGLDQLFSIINSYVGLQHIPMFGMIVNGQNQSEVGERIFMNSI